MRNIFGALVITICLCGPGIGFPLPFALACNVLDFGALGDGVRNDQAEIQQALESCEEIFFPADKIFLSGSLFLRSNQRVVIDGVLRGVSPYEGSLNDTYPFIYTRRGGTMTYTRASLVNGGQCNSIDYKPLALGDQCSSWDKLTNVTITGTGTIDGGGDQGWFTDELLKRVRPTLLGLSWIHDLTLTDLTLRNPPFWTTHLLFCDGVYVSGLRIDTVGCPNGDGIDPDSSKNVLIENCNINSSDDVIAIKSGKDQDGLAVAMPCENITVRNMQFYEGHGVSIGSETSGDIRGVYIHDLSLNGTDRGVRIKSQKGRGGIVEDVVYENINVTDVETAISITMYYTDDGHGPAPTFRNIQVKNVVGHGNGVEEVGEIACLPESPCIDMLFEDINLSVAEDQNYDCQNVEGTATNVVPEISCLS